MHFLPGKKKSFSSQNATTEKPILIIKINEAEALNRSKNNRNISINFGILWPTEVFPIFEKDNQVCMCLAC